MKKKFIKIAAGFAVCLVCVFLLTSCSNKKEESQETDSMFTDRDMEIGYDEQTSAKITLTGDGAQSDSDAVTISENVVTISEMCIRDRDKPVHRLCRSGPRSFC